MTNGSIFVTGPNGFIGSNVVRTLVKDQRKPRCLVRPTSRLDRIADLACDLVKGDVRDRDSLSKAMAGCEAIIHLAAVVTPALYNSPLMNEVVVEGTRNILDAAMSAGIRRMVYVSSTATIGGSPEPFIHSEEHTTPPAVRQQLRYCRAKLAAEELCQEYIRRGMSITIVNPADVFGPNDTDKITAGALIDFASTSPVFVCKGGVSVVHVEDVAVGIVKCLDRGRSGERYILSGENLTVRQLAELTLEFAEQKRNVITLPRKPILAIAFLGRKFKIPLPFDPEVVPYATSYWFMDNSKARHELGMEFRDARETLKSTVQWLRKCRYVK
jgi:dihydroflavonol-4-reductase